MSNPKGPCTQIDILRPQSSPYMGTLGSKYTHMDTWTLRVSSKYQGFGVQELNLGIRAQGLGFGILGLWFLRF